MTEPVIRVLIVDDEQPARARLRQMLVAFGDLQVVGEAEDGEAAIEKIMEAKPDLVFLDIQMPGCSGMEVAASLPSPRPRIIFCTAFDEYAVDAFELQAADYLLKPVSRARLQKALERIRGISQEELEASQEQVRKSAGSFPSRFLAKRASRYRVIPGRDVLFFCSDEGNTRLQTREHRYWMQPSLADLEQRLDPDSFFRVSRSTIVNLDSVKEVRQLPGGYGELELADGTRVDVSRRRFKALLERLSQA